MNWISVEDRLPDKLSSVLAWDGESIHWAFFASVEMWVSSDSFLYGITHWMPLPAPPEEE